MRRYAEQLDGFDFIGFEVQEGLIRIAQKRNPKAQIIHKAVSDRNDKLKVIIPKTYGQNYRGGTTVMINKIPLENVENETIIESLRLSDFLKDKANLYDFIVVKMDIEGAEYGIIEDLYNIYIENGRKLIDYLMIEYHPEVLSSENHLRYQKMLDYISIETSTWV